ncbi:hypothetical protein [Hymenobacter coccineus]|uniref:hypothetical protein n=1 Tax=Hymenobacter coccineus TaxID=1908235 RepID=UPI000F7A3AEC|nr:hypothetical protein [Hymenobacter coccineus]
MKTALFNHVVNVLRLVATPGSIQEKLYNDKVVVADEVALDYSDAVQQANVLLINKEISSEIYEQLLSLDTDFDQMANNPQLWDRNAFLNDQKWKNIRNKALSILSAMKETYELPYLDTDNTYIFE